MSFLQWVYDAGIRGYSAAIHLAAFFQPKAREWVRGRNGWKAKLKPADPDPSGKTCWFHCASLGEFEQARPLIEALKAKRPRLRIVLSFFSPSGYLVRKDYPLAEQVCYLPIDTKSNAAFFLDRIRPDAAFFIRYDLWLNFLSALNERKIPTYLVSAKLSPKSAFLHSPFAPMYRKAFRDFKSIFCQDEETLRQLSAFSGKENLRLSGDTRFDRVIRIAEENQAIPAIETFCAGKFCIIAGSMHEAEEKMLISLAEKWKDKDLKWILAPHEPEGIAERIQAEGCIALSNISELQASHRILLIDSVGLLNRIYRYGHFAVIGGGFGKGIHNIQEPAVFGLPVAFGPNHEKFAEAKDMLSSGAAQEFRNEKELEQILENAIRDEADRKRRAALASGYIREKAGATRVIIEELEKQGA